MEWMTWNVFEFLGYKNGFWEGTVVIGKVLNCSLLTFCVAFFVRQRYTRSANFPLKFGIRVPLFWNSTFKIFYIFVNFCLSCVWKMFPLRSSSLDKRIGSTLVKKKWNLFLNQHFLSYHLTNSLYLRRKQIPSLKSVFVPPFNTIFTQRLERGRAVKLP